jgi:hypothetical protein
VVLFDYLRCGSLADSQSQSIRFSELVDGTAISASHLEEVGFTSLTIHLRDFKAHRLWPCERSNLNRTRPPSGEASGLKGSIGFTTCAHGLLQSLVHLFFTYKEIIYISRATVDHLRVETCGLTDSYLSLSLFHCQKI